ncbi:MAG TPA: GNAT family N-acetyltransferase [Candidatus Polarisedimenticolia bacterium]|nr:GNAT family N-acetyltransferase [Candidatus Polarisedimenticolia bacterium]
MAPPTISIRQATPRDAPGILACLLAAFEPYRAQYTPEGFRDTTLDAGALGLRLAAMTVLVAAEHDKVVGTIAFSLEGTEGHLRGMAVLPDRQGSDLAAGLLSRAEADLRARGCTRVHLGTTEPLERAVRFYRRRGFMPTGRVEDFFGMRLHEYAKRLGSGAARAADECRIRPATPRDLDVVLLHRRRMFEEMGFRDPAALEKMLEVSATLLGRGLADGSYRGWLAEAPDGRVVAGGGIIILTFQPHPVDPRPQRAWVVNMFTEPEYQRRGLARRLVREMIDWSRAQGLRYLYLHASDAGRPLYESMGFIANNEMRISL